MAIELVNASSVVVGHDVNLSIFRPPWLRDQRILTDEELAGDVVISPPMVRIPAPSFELLILPDRVQLRPSNDSREAQADVVRVLGGIASTLPHTPFTAIGLNFEYRITPDQDVDFGSWNREEFAAPFTLAVAGNDGLEVRFGVYYSFEALGMRLNADLRPVRKTEPSNGGTESGGEPTESMVGKYNFHHDLAERRPVGEILRVLGRWSEAAALAREMAQSASAGRRNG